VVHATTLATYRDGVSAHAVVDESKQMLSLFHENVTARGIQEEIEVAALGRSRWARFWKEELRISFYRGRDHRPSHRS
jgi:hypothetical protein